MSTAKFNLRHNNFRSAFVCTSLLITLVISGNALAQRGGGGRGIQGMMGMRGLGAMLEPDFNRRDITLFNDDLSLDSTQRMIIETLFGEYAEAIQTARQDLTTTMQEFRPEATPEQEAARQQARDKMRSGWQSLRQQMEMARDPSLSEATRQELQEAVDRRSAQMREESREAFGPQIEPERLEELASQATDQYKVFSREKSRLREQFISDLLLLLTEDQKPLWPSLDRKLVRQKTLQQGQLSGESADLIVIARELNIETQGDSGIASIFGEYEITLDHALKARNSYTEETRADGFTALMERDGKRSLALHDGEMSRRKTIRDVNESFVVTVSQALETELSQEFVDNYRKRAFSRLYRTTPTQRVFEQAMNIQDIDPDIAEALSGIQESYEMELAIANEQMLHVIKSNEPKQRRRWLERMASGNFFQRGQNGRGQRNEDPIREGYQSKDKLDDRYFDQLISILTPDQAEKLKSPQMQREEQRREQRQGRFGGNNNRGRGGQNGRDGGRGGGRRGGRGSGDADAN